MRGIGTSGYPLTHNRLTQSFIFFTLFFMTRHTTTVHWQGRNVVQKTGVTTAIDGLDPSSSRRAALVCTEAQQLIIATQAICVEHYQSRSGQGFKGFTQHFCCI